MLNKRIIATLSLGVVSAPLMAESSTMGIEWITNKSILYALYVLIVVLIIMVFLLSKTLSHLTEHFNEGQRPEERRNFWERTFQLKAISTDKDMMLDHEYDGIRELGNPPPPWFMFLFYGTILFAVIYFYRFSISGSGPTQIEEYDREMKIALDAQKAKEAKQAAAGEAVGEVTASTVAFTDDATVLKAGKQIYNTYCKVCHQDGGKGNIGPNLTDDYWLHGGSPKEIFMTIENGVPPNMTAWKGTLTGKQISDVTNYVMNLDLIDEAAGGKKPEGDEFIYDPNAEPEEEAPAADTTNAAQDTTTLNNES